jgi:hypothetical protein
MPYSRVCLVLQKNFSRFLDFSSLAASLNSLALPGETGACLLELVQFGSEATEVVHGGFSSCLLLKLDSRRSVQ